MIWLPAANPDIRLEFRIPASSEFSIHQVGTLS